MGFVYTMLGSSYYDSFSFKQTYDCPSQKFTIDYNVGTYTSEEKEIFRNENYCLRLYYQGLADMGLISGSALNLEKKSITKEDCSNAVIFPSSQDYATCAYASYNFKLLDGSAKTLNTCLYISKSAFNTKELDQHLQMSFNGYTNVDGIKIQSFKIEINDKSGKSLSYDSQAGTLAETTADTNNKGEITRISIILTIMIMIYLL